MSDFNLSSFLAQQSSEGISQGSGEFTISHEKAARKMAEYSLPREHAWVLKLIQAGVGWGCQSIRITQTQLNSTLHFEFSTYRDLPTNQQVVAAILRADLESQKPLDSFAMGLRLLVEKSHLSFLLLIDTADVEPQAIYAGVYFAEMKEQKRAEIRSDWGHGVTLMINHVSHTEPNRLLKNFIPIQRHGLPMALELTQYAFTCPVPLLLDGRRVDGIFRAGFFSWSSTFKPLRASGMELVGDEPRFSISPGFFNKVYGVFTPVQKLTKEDAPHSAEAFFLLAADNVTARLSLWTAPRNTLYWVRNGVIVDHEELPSRAGLTKLYVFVSAEGIGTDLTGFQLRESETKLKRKTRVLSRLIQVLDIEIQAERNLMEKPPSITEMEEHELAELPSQARVFNRGLQLASHALDEADARLGKFRNFAKGLVANAYKALNVAVSEPDRWTSAQFKELYPRELESLVKALEKEVENFEEKREQVVAKARLETIPEKPPLKASKQAYSWRPPEDRSATK